MFGALTLKMHLFLLKPMVRRSQSSAGELRFLLYVLSNWGICASVLASQKVSELEEILSLPAEPFGSRAAGKGVTGRALLLLSCLLHRVLIKYLEAGELGSGPSETALFYGGKAPKMWFGDVALQARCRCARCPLSSIPGKCDGNKKGL